MANQWVALAMLNVVMVAADVQVFKGGSMFIVADFLDAEANFGLAIPDTGITTMVVLAEPEDGCGKIQRPPNMTEATYWAVLIKRYNCSFEEKVFNAQEAFYDVAIVHNVDSNELEIMNASNPKRINIHAVFITGNAGKEIKTKYLYNKGYFVRVVPNTNDNYLERIILPSFFYFFLTCCVLLLYYWIKKCIRDRRRAVRMRMPYSSLDQVPTAIFRKNDPFETCAICLDDFIEGEKLRVLPCSHAYHCRCIDPWLTRNRRTCPMCKRKVFAAGENVGSDSSSDEEDNDNTPLLRGTTTQTNDETRRVQWLLGEIQTTLTDVYAAQQSRVGGFQNGESDNSSYASLDVTNDNTNEVVVRSPSTPEVQGTRDDHQNHRLCPES